MQKSQTLKPNPLAPKAEKIEDSYGLSWGKYIQSKAIGQDYQYYKDRRERIRESRAFAQGDQSNALYKQLNNATGDTSPLNLDWTPLGIGAKFVSSLVADILGEFNINVRAIDASSMSKRNDEKKKILGNFFEKEFIQELKDVTGIDIAESEFIPEELDEVDLHMSITYKQSVEVAMKQVLMYNLELNNYPEEIRESIILDLIVAGMGVAKVELDPNYGIVTRYVDVENFVFSEASKPNASNPSWAGEMRWMSIGDIRRLSGKKFSDKELEKIYKTHSGRWDNQNFYDDYYSNYNNTSNDNFNDFYYDTLVVPVLDFAFKAEDKDVVKVTKSKYGERRYLKSDTYKPSKKSSNVDLETDTYESVYTGMYILGTDYIFNYGLMRNMVRPNKSLSKVELPYKVCAPKFFNMTNKSLMELMIPCINQINLSYLKMQQTIATTHPEVTVIDIEGWLNMSMGGKDWSPLELQDIFDAKGIVYTKSRGESGEPIPDPVRTYSNRVNIEPYIASINYNTQLIREMIGFTPEREGVTQSKQLVGVTELSIASSRNSTKFIENALNEITKSVCRDIAWRVQDMPKSSHFYKTYEEAIGAADMAVVSSMDDIPLADFGIFINTLPSQEERMTLEESLQRGITQGSIRDEDAMMVRKLARSSGIDTAYQYMSVKRKRYAKEKLQMEEAMKMQETQRALQVQEAAAQAKQMEQQGDAQLIQVKNTSELEKEITILREKYALEMEVAAKQFEYDYILKSAEDEGQIGKEKYKEDRKDERVEKTAKINAKQQAEIMRVKEGQKGEVDTEKIALQDNNLEELLS